MGAFFTWVQGVGVTNLGGIFTHSLSFAPASLVARVFLHQGTNTATVPLAILSIGTNHVTYGAGVSTLMTVDVEVQMPHSVIQ